MSLQYPSDVADVFFECEAASHRRSQQLRAPIPRVPGAPLPAPSRAVLVQLIETMFFASMVTEEAHMHPTGVVFAEKIAQFRIEQGPAWDFMNFAAAPPFDVPTIARLASACAWPQSFLAVVQIEGELRIAGIITPHSYHFLSSDHMVRVLVPKPGVVDVCRGESVVVRYERGAMRVPMVPPARGPHRSQFDSIQQRVLGEQAMDLPFDVRDSLLNIIEAMVGLGRGGLIAILGPSESADQSFIQESWRLEPPLSLGSALVETLRCELIDNANDERRFLRQGDALGKAPRTEEEARDTKLAKQAAESLARLLEQISRLTTVDGAVVMSHGLDVLAFGSKLPTPEHPIPEVLEATADGRLEELWRLDERGTRHRAAAAFVAGYPERLAVIVSQDGDAATFQMIDNKLVRWPLWSDRMTTNAADPILD